MILSWKRLGSRESIPGRRRGGRLFVLPLALIGEFDNDLKGKMA
jgi:hypothetical protein